MQRHLPCQPLSISTNSSFCSLCKTGFWCFHPDAFTVHLSICSFHQPQSLLPGVPLHSSCAFSMPLSIFFPISFYIQFFTWGSADKSSITILTKSFFRNLRSPWCSLRIMLFFKIMPTAKQLGVFPSSGNRKVLLQRECGFVSKNFISRHNVHVGP